MNIIFLRRVETLTQILQIHLSFPTRKKFILKKLPNSSETEDMRKNSADFTELYSKKLEQFQNNYRIRDILL